MLIELPNEIIEMITSYLNNRDERLMRVNKLFYDHLNRKKLDRFQSTKNTLFNYLIDFQSKSFEFLTKKHHDNIYNIYYSSKLQYNFYNIYDKCIFNIPSKYLGLKYDEFTVNKNGWCDESQTDKANIFVKNLYFAVDFYTYHILIYFDIFYFDLVGDLCFKIYEDHSNPKNITPTYDCNLCSKTTISKSFKVERIKDNNLYKDFSININDEDCLEKLHILFSSVFNNIGKAWTPIPYDISHHNSKSGNFMSDEI